MCSRRPRNKSADSSMGGSAHLNFSAGMAVAGGGMFGYYKAASMPSLVGGVVAGGALIAAGGLIQSGSDVQGHSLGAATGWALTAGMAPRAITSGKFMPAGVAAAVGLIAAIYNTKKAKDWGAF